MIDSHLVDIHETTAHYPTAWYHCALTLLESADYLWRGLKAGARDKILDRQKYMDSHYSTCDLLLFILGCRTVTVLCSRASV